MSFLRETGFCLASYESQASIFTDPCMSLFPALIMIMKSGTWMEHGTSAEEKAEVGVSCQTQSRIHTKTSLLKCSLSS